MARSQALPDRRGRFGQYGGRFVPELLMSPLDELPARLRSRAQEQAVQSPSPGAAPALGGPAVAALPRRAAVRGARRRADLAQARGPPAHRRAQDQQHHRSGAAGEGDGEDARDRRDRRRAARRRHRRRGRAARARVHRLHGLRGHAPPAPQRRPHAAPRRRGGRGRRRQPHAQGRHQRGDARLGDDGAHHALHPRLGARPRSLSAHGPRLPEGDRRRGARSAAQAGEAAPTPTW